MNDLAIDENGDIILNAVGDGLETVNDEWDDIAQSVRIILGTRLGEYVHDREMGLNRINLFTGKDGKINPYLIDDINTALMQDERITDAEIGDSFFDAQNRELSISIKVNLATDESRQLEVGVNANDFI
ncbi:hypothetical protein [Lentilactobacillus senioris]|uniref:hypothetical protein n=1 Tax=Lentilactobacillus senioris TaxID=931534 RepID=UPI003D26670C